MNLLAAESEASLNKVNWSLVLPLKFVWHKDIMITQYQPGCVSFIFTWHHLITSFCHHLIYLSQFPKRQIIPGKWVVAQHAAVAWCLLCRCDKRERRKWRGVDQPDGLKLALSGREPVQPWGCAVAAWLAESDFCLRTSKEAKMAGRLTDRFGLGIWGDECSLSLY